jgi:hypothetical protein
MRVAVATLLGRAEAAGIVLHYWSHWLDAVGRAEHDERNMYFSVAIKAPRPTVVLVRSNKGFL